MTKVKKEKKDVVNNVVRIDTGFISDKHIDESTGFLRVTGYPTKAGIYTYYKSDGSIVKEYISEEELFKADSIESLKQRPLTNTHPKGFVNMSNAKKLQVGYNGDSIEKEYINDEAHVKTTVVVNDSATVSKVANGIIELSCGYTCQVVPYKGEYKGEKYDAIQVNRRYNHIALVPKGRAGSTASLRLDAANNIDLSFNETSDLIREKLLVTYDPMEYYVKEVYTDYFIYVTNDNKMFKQTYKIENEEVVFLGIPLEVELIYIEKKEDTMQKIVLDGKEIEVLDTIADAYNKAISEKEQLKVKVDTFEADKAKLEAKNDSLQAEIMTLKNDAANNKGIDITKAVKERIDVLEVAQRFCKKESISKFDVLDNMAIKKEIVKAVYPSLNVEGKNDAYFEAHFDLLKEKHMDATEDLGDSINSAEASKDIDKIRQDSINKDAIRWQKPLAVTL